MTEENCGLCCVVAETYGVVAYVTARYEDVLVTVNGDKISRIFLAAVPCVNIQEITTPSLLFT